MGASNSCSGQSLTNNCAAPSRRCQRLRRAVIKASLKDVAGVLVFSALPFL